MTQKPISLTVNGRPVRAQVTPRTHLADFLREQLLLTGTHIGCEHGICGACTVSIDGEIARACITYAVACDGADVQTIEGFDDDPLMARLRAAFTAEHALQCGYCTPGMLVAARDLIRRKRDLSRAAIRTEMSGNLCRCTGYVGIVSAIAGVMAQADLPAAEAPRAPRTWLGPAPGPTADAPLAPLARAPTHHARTLAEARGVPRTAHRVPIPVTVGAIAVRDGATALTQSFVLPHPLEAVWQLMADPRAVARCLPGLVLEAAAGPLRDASAPDAGASGQPLPSHADAPLPLTGRLDVRIGPVSASFAGEGTFQRVDGEHRVVIDGRGGDRKSGSRVSGGMDYRLARVPGDAGLDATRIDAAMRYTLTGPLAQLGRSNLARDLVRRIGEAFAANLDAQLADPATALPAASLGGLSLLLRVLADRLRALFGRA